MSDETLLDNPVWCALNSAHLSMARKNGMAARYPQDVSRFAGLALPTPEAFADLAALVQPGEAVALFTAQKLEPPPQWRIERARPIEQMVCERPPLSASDGYVELDASDIPQMLALAAATEPGPFAAGTIRMGRYIGFKSRDGKRLMAMAGQRLRLDGFTEISAVCTDPAFRGHGYARSLVATLSADIFADGAEPFLHVKTENGAKRLYETLGFRVRRSVALTVLILKPQ
jgi:predicted GNAT family acetyltransferase